MVVEKKDVKRQAPDPEAMARNLKTTERLIDGELRCNADRLAEGKEVMISCLMPVANYEQLLVEYRRKGWNIRHEPSHAYGRLYFRK